MMCAVAEPASLLGGECLLQGVLPKLQSDRPGAGSALLLQPIQSPIRDRWGGNTSGSRPAPQIAKIDDYSDGDS